MDKISITMQLSSSMRNRLSLDLYSYVLYSVFRLDYVRFDSAEAVFIGLELLFSNWLSISLTMFFNFRLILEVNNSRTFREQQLSSRDNSAAVNNSRRVTVTMTVIVIAGYI
jgi:hypothetical protein